MTTPNVEDYLKLAPMFKELPKVPFWLAYDADVDAAYINFQSPAQEADDSEMTDGGVIVRYDQGGEVIGLTILNTSQRQGKSND